MKYSSYVLIPILSLFFLSSPSSLNACDDTLVMLLTAKNPTSEFSKTIRSFMNSLTTLGSALKYSEKEDFSAEINTVLEAWLDFSKKYMTNPPEEAKNDRQWQEKMSLTSQRIGEIRKLISSKKYLEAHNNVLELSNTIGTFFEAVGISEEKRIFINTSSDINDLQRLVENKLYTEASEKVKTLQSDLLTFKSYLTDDDSTSASNTAEIINTILISLSNNESPNNIDKDVIKLRTSFEELRSRILMNEWFSNEDDKQEVK